MAWTTTETNRVESIETALNNIQTAMLNLVNRNQMIAYTTVRQNEIDTLTTKVASLEARMTTLEARVTALE